jgi:aminoglycoside/choline kinase family phosphotransferase
VNRELLTTFLRRAGYELGPFEALAGDVSPRRYARLGLSSGESAVVAFYPEESTDACLRFERSTELLERAGVRVPRVLAADCSRGFMLLEDLGAKTLFDHLADGRKQALGYFREAVAAAAQIANLDPGPVAELNPPLDGELLTKELEQTRELYLEPLGLLGGDPATRQRAVGALEELCSALGAARLVPCHRDFMARNLVPQGGAVAVLDHQDLRLGPPGYDLASLLNDSFFPTADAEAELLALARLSNEERLTYHRSALQRTLKAIGTFAAFAKRGSDRHLPLIPPTLERARRQLAEVPEMAATVAALEPLWARHLAAAKAQ